MLKSIRLGKKTFPINIIQGPLAGISCAPFRRMVWEYGQPAFSCTEMISCKTLIYQPQFSHKRFVAKDPKEGPVCFQLATHCPKELAEATRIATDYGADLIDLNCGCPVKKIRNKKSGSALLSEASHLFNLITAMKNNTDVPVSIKIRVDAGKDSNNQAIAKVAEEAGIDFLVVHGRHWTEHYETACRHEEIKFFVQQLNIPVIGNGDIRCITSLKQMLATGCAGVMISRATVGQPWLIQQLMTELTGEKFLPPSLIKIKDLFLQHVSELIMLLGKERFAILQARQFAKYYGRSLALRNSFIEEVNRCEDFAVLKMLCEKYFK